MKITLYQIIPGPENRHLIFSDLRSIRVASGGHVPAEIYEAVFSGELDIAVSPEIKNKPDQEIAELEAIFVRFNISHPEGFCGRSMTMSDVVEVIRSESESRFSFATDLDLKRLHLIRKKLILAPVGRRKDKIMKKLILNYKGRDSWDRPVYESEGQLYVDINPREGYRPSICTKYNNEFDGEPDMPIAEDITLKFVPSRDIW